MMILVKILVDILHLSPNITDLSPTDDNTPTDNDDFEANDESLVHSSFITFLMTRPWPAQEWIVGW